MMIRMTTRIAGMYIAFSPRNVGGKETSAGGESLARSFPPHCCSTSRQRNCSASGFSHCYSCVVSHQSEEADRQDEAQSEMEGLALVLLPVAEHPVGAEQVHGDAVDCHQR